MMPHKEEQITTAGGHQAQQVPPSAQFPQLPSATFEIQGGHLKCLTNEM
jgi:hypothetical protein